MVCKGELPLVSDTQENREGIAEHPFSIHGDVGLPGRFCKVQAEEGCIAFGCVKGQSRFISPSDHFIYFWLLGRRDHVLIAGTTGYQQIISIGTHKGILHEFGQGIICVDCEKEGGKDGALGQTFLESSSCNAMCYATLCLTDQCCAALCCVVLLCVVLCCTVLYCTMLYTMLCFLHYWYDCLHSTPMHV